MRVRAGEGEWWLGKVWRVNQCLDSAVWASAVKLVNPEKQGINSAGGNRLGRGALEACCPQPQCHATGLLGPAAPHPTPYPSKASSRHCLTYYVQTDLCSNTHTDIQKTCTTAHQYIIAVVRLEGLREKSEGVFTGAYWFQCN